MWSAHDPNLQPGAKSTQTQKTCGVNRGREREREGEKKTLEKLKLKN